MRCAWCQYPQYPLTMDEWLTVLEVGTFPISKHSITERLQLWKNFIKYGAPVKKNCKNAKTKPCHKCSIRAFRMLDLTPFPKFWEMLGGARSSKYDLRKRVWKLPIVTKGTKNGDKGALYNLTDVWTSISLFLLIFIRIFKNPKFLKKSHKNSKFMDYTKFCQLRTQTMCTCATIIVQLEKTTLYYTIFRTCTVIKRQINRWCLKHEILNSRNVLFLLLKISNTHYTSGQPGL